jgi:hypothetical protein
VITDNEAFAGGGLYYGCELPLQMTNSTVSNNRAEDKGIRPDGTLLLSFNIVINVMQT